MAAQQGLQFTFRVVAQSEIELAVVRFDWLEALSEPFLLQLDLASREGRLRCESLLNRRGQLTIWFDGQVRRQLDGIIVSATQGASGGRRSHYRLQLRPPLWRLQLRHNSRIFQGVPPQQIIATLLQEHGVRAHRFVLRHPHEAREYCVQYRETDLAFVQRLAAEEGLFYFHAGVSEDGQPLLVWADDPGALQPGGEITFNPQPHLLSLGAQIQRLDVQQQLCPTRVTLQDYSFLQPHHDLQLQRDLPDALSVPAGEGWFEHYDYPGRFQQESRGQALTHYRFDALRQDAVLADGDSNACGLQPGFRFQLRGHPADETNVAWQPVRVRHSGEQPQALEEEAGREATRYRNQFQAVPARQCWRPYGEVKPRVDGPQVARVVGPEGEEIYCDEHGRVKVQFPWDRQGGNNEHSSCWVRVSQGWAGGHYGCMALPRVGHEVIVSFLEGDPDQPIITGRTYHGVNRPPYALPAHKSRTVLRSETYRGDGFNELSFEDLAGQESIYLHGQRDLQVRLGADARWQIGHDQHLHIGHDRLAHLAGDDHLRVQGESRCQIAQDYSLIIDHSMHQKLGESWQVAAGQAIHLQAGTNIVLDARSELTIQAGGSFIKLDAGGITLQGPCIRLNSGGEPGQGSAWAGLEPLSPTGVGAPEYQAPPIPAASSTPTVDVPSATSVFYRFSE